MMWILRSGDRQQASQPAPAQGLTLMAVSYPEPTGLPGGPHPS
jgi:tRNA U38,U39,U40 pseudouridine synthase TruA